MLILNKFFIPDQLSMNDSAHAFCVSEFPIDVVVSSLWGLVTNRGAVVANDVTRCGAIIGIKQSPFDKAGQPAKALDADSPRIAIDKTTGSSEWMSILGKATSTSEGGSSRQRRRNNAARSCAR